MLIAVQGVAIEGDNQRQRIGLNQFDAVFIGTYEPERCASINALAESGASAVVYGETKGNWRQSHPH